MPSLLEQHSLLNNSAHKKRKKKKVKYSLNIFSPFHVSQKLVSKEPHRLTEKLHALGIRNCGVLQELHRSKPEILPKSHFFQHLIKGAFF